MKPSPPPADHLDDHAVAALQPAKPSWFSLATGLPYWGIVAVVVLAPLAHAANEPWSWSVLATVVGALLVVWALQAALGHEHPTVRLKSLLPLLIPFAIVIIWATVQMSSWTPVTWHHPLWPMAEEALATSLDGAVSLSPDGSAAAITRLLGYAGVFWLSLQYGRRDTEARHMIAAVVFAGAVYAAYGLIGHVALQSSVFGGGSMLYLPVLSSTFATGTAYADYAGVALICATGALLGTLSDRVGRHAGSRRRWRRAIDDLRPVEWLLLAAWLLIVTAISLSGSTRSLSCLVIGLTVLVVALARSRAVADRVVVLLGGSVAVAVVVAVMLIGSEPDAPPTSIGTGASARDQVHAITIAAAEGAPLLGTGLGSFVDVFRFYQSPGIEPSASLTAPNAVLKAPLELGVPAAMALFAVIAVAVLYTLRGVRARRRDARYAAVGLAVAVLVSVQAVAGVGMQTPAAVITVCMVLGVGIAQSWSSRRKEDRW